ncbi:MAG: hypothetical protein ACTHKT_09900 [Solirubrobacterales bacterium]
MTAEGPPQLVRLAENEFPGYIATFALDGTNGYSIGFSAYDEEGDGRGRIYISVRRKGSSASYSAPATLTESVVQSDLGAFGRIDLTVRPSGREKTIRIKCTHEKFTYEPAIYEGIVEFKGEGGYTRAHATSVPKPPALASFCSHGSGYGEARGEKLPGARLAGLSFSHRRNLTFQLNKNRPDSRTLFKASLKERRHGIVIRREVTGFASAAAFRFDRALQKVSVGSAAPFSGSATLRRSPNSASPLLAGDLALDFPGHPHVPLAGPTVHISIGHARYTRSNSSSIKIGF